jgi:hypothetical protein
LEGSQSSKPLNTKKPPISSFFSRRLVYNPFFLLAGACLFDEKIRQNVALFSFGLRDVGILYSQAAMQRPIVDFPAFLETGLTEKIAVCDHTTRDPNR